MNIEALNFIKKRSFLCLIIWGCIPIFNLALLVFIIIWYIVIIPKVRLRQLPFLLVFKHKNVGKISHFGFFFLFLTVFYTVMIVFFPEKFPAVIETAKPLITFIIQFCIFAFPLFMTGIALFVYNQHYREYIGFVNSFLNNIMMRNQQAGSFNSPVYFNAVMDTDETTKLMLEDLEKNNIIRLEDDTASYRKAIFFTADFQKVLLGKTSAES